MATVRDIELSPTSDVMENTTICQPCEDEGKKCTAVGNQEIIEKVEHVGDICCKSEMDGRDCEITGLVLLPDQKLFVSDFGTDNSVKLIDINQKKIVSALMLSSGSYASCRIMDTLVAVTLPVENKINFIRIHQNLRLSVEKEFGVNGTPWGIDCLDDRLVVSSFYYNNPHKVEIMDMQGKVISIFDKDSNGQPLFNGPHHVAINPHNKLLYVSNNGSHSVVCMQLDGTLVATYKDKDLTRPRQVTFDRRGMLYVCADGSHNVHQITEDCKKFKVFIPSTEKMSKSSSICYQEKRERLIIGQWDYNSIKVYQIGMGLDEIAADDF